MKVQLAVLVSVAAAYAPLSVQAAECSAAQRDSANVLNVGTEFETACAAVFNADGKSEAGLDPAKLLAANSSTLSVLAPCKQPSCAAFLKKQADKVPDCEISGINTRVVFKTIVDFCSNATAPPPKTASEKQAAGSGSGSGMGKGSIKTIKVPTDGSKLGSGIATVPSPESKSKSKTETSAPPTTVGDSDTDKDKDKATNATKANTKSDANSAAFAGATAIVAGGLLVLLCM